MQLDNGYEMQSTFWNDFTIADHYGEEAIDDTFERAFKEWKNDYVMLTELVIVLNHKIWQYYQTNYDIAVLYNKLWEKADNYACTHLKGKELSHFFKVTD